MTQLLAAQVRALITERDRLSGRIALLESSIDDMSGTIKKTGCGNGGRARSKGKSARTEYQDTGSEPAGGERGQRYDRIYPTQSFAEGGPHPVSRSHADRPHPQRVCG